MFTVRQLTVTWIILITLSAAAAYVGELNLDHQSTLTPSIVAFIIISLIIKGQLVVDYFMGLKQVSWLWRSIMSAFCIVIGAIMYAAY